MPIPFTCTCGKHLEEADDYPEDFVTCPACGREVPVAGWAAAAPGSTDDRGATHATNPAAPSASGNVAQQVGTYLKAGVAVWVVLAFLMLGFAVVQGGGAFGLSMGRGPALTLLFIAFAIYAVWTVAFMLRPHDWIQPDAEDPEARRIYRALAAVSEKAALPMPRVALDDDAVEINAYTYGLSRQTARIHVTRGLLNHVQPTDDELEAILAHEMGHVRHGDCVIATLLQFPVWLMDKIRWLLSMARWVGFQMLRAAGQVAVGWVGLIVLLGLIVFVIYLSVLIGMVSAAMAVTMIALYAFEREREYLADGYAALVSGSEQPLQRALAKLEQAADRVRAEYQKRMAAAGEGAEINLEVAAPAQAFTTTDYIETAKSVCPSFVESVRKQEIFHSHPLASSRSYFLSYPEGRGQALARFYARLAGAADGAVRWAVRSRPPCSGTASRVGIMVGAAVGMLLAVLPGFVHHWIVHVCLVLGVVLGGLALGLCTRRQAWDGETFLRHIVAAAYVAATVLLVVGTLFRSPLVLWFPLAFVAAWPVLGGLAVLSARGLDWHAGKQTPPDDEEA